MTRTAGAKKPAQELRRNGRVRVVASGSSMWPRLRHGAVLEVTPVRGRELLPGDLVVFSGRGKLVTHRVLAVSPRGVESFGDSQAGSDGVIPFRRILGRARIVSQPPLRPRLPAVADAQRLASAARWAMLVWLMRWL